MTEKNPGLCTGCKGRYASMGSHGTGQKGDRPRGAAWPAGRPGLHGVAGPGSGVLFAEAELLDAGAERGGADAQ